MSILRHGQNQLPLLLPILRQRHLLQMPRPLLPDCQRRLPILQQDQQLPALQQRSHLHLLLKRLQPSLLEHWRQLRPALLLQCQQLQALLQQQR